MDRDYRNTKYCPSLGDIEARKKLVEEQIKKDHPKATDMHRYLCKNDDVYKDRFIKTYNGKCAYCGVSLSIIPKCMFEIDHIINEASFSSKPEAGHMDNLTLACHYCNRKKHDFKLSSHYLNFLHPDRKGIATLFIRDEMYYIRISKGNKKDPVICEFYSKLNLGSSLRRIDYLLMNMEGLINRTKGNTFVHDELQTAYEMLRKKRNAIG